MVKASSTGPDTSTWRLFSRWSAALGAALCLVLAYNFAQGWSWIERQGVFPFDYGTPHGTVYSLSSDLTNVSPGGWTVATVRDVFADRYSFTAFVPTVVTQNQPTQIEILTASVGAAQLVRKRVEADLSSHSQDGDVTFQINRPTRKVLDNTPDRANAPLDPSIVPGSVLFVRFQCDVIEVGPEDQGAASPCLTLSAKAQNAVAPPTGIVRHYVRELGVVAAQPSLVQRLWVLGLVILTFGLLAWAIFGSRSYGGLRYLAIGRDNRYSNSQFQTVVWFFVLLVALTSTQLFRVAQGGLPLIGWIGIPASLLALSGLSALTFVGAAIITDQGVKNAQVLKPEAAAPSFPHDLFHDDAGKFDLGDFQATLISVLASLAYLVILLGFLGSLSLKRDALPDVEATILTIFGLAQGAYLVKKGLRVSEQQGVALTVSPEIVKCSTGTVCEVMVTVTWTQTYHNRTLHLSALLKTDHHIYPGLTFAQATIQLNASSRRMEVKVPVTNPGAGKSDEVVIRGVVDQLVRTADLTVEGT